MTSDLCFPRTLFFRSTVKDNATSSLSFSQRHLFYQSECFKVGKITWNVKSAVFPFEQLPADFKLSTRGKTHTNYQLPMCWLSKINRKGHAGLAWFAVWAPSFWLAHGHFSKRPDMDRERLWSFFVLIVALVLSDSEPTHWPHLTFIPSSWAWIQIQPRWGFRLPHRNLGI